MLISACLSGLDCIRLDCKVRQFFPCQKLCVVSGKLLDFVLDNSGAMLLVGLLCAWGGNAAHSNAEPQTSPQTNPQTTRQDFRTPQKSRHAKT